MFFSKQQILAVSEGDGGAAVIACFNRHPKTQEGHGGRLNHALDKTAGETARQKGQDVQVPAGGKLKRTPEAFRIVPGVGIRKKQPLSLGVGDRAGNGKVLPRPSFRRLRDVDDTDFAAEAGQNITRRVFGLIIGYNNFKGTVILFKKGV